MDTVRIISVLTGILALAGLLSAVISQQWIRSRTGLGEGSGRLLVILKSRLTDFRRTQYVSYISIAVLVGAALGVGVSWKHAAVYLVGAVICFAAMTISSASYVHGTAAAFNAASQGNMITSLRTSLRSGYSASVTSASIAVMVPAMLLFIFKAGSVIKFIPCLALGAAVTSLIYNTGGQVYSSAYDLAVRNNDFTDRVGSFYGMAAETAESVMIAVTAAIMLAEVGLDTSGVDSTFKLSEAAGFPVLIAGAGILSSLIGCMLYRGTSRKNPASDCLVCIIISAIIEAVISIIASINILQSPVYAWAIISGIIASVLITVYSGLFSPDGRIMMEGGKSDRSLGRHAVAVFNLATGMIGSAGAVLILIVSIIISYNFAGLYGIAISAAAVAGLQIVSGAVMGSRIVAGSAGEILHSALSSEKDDQTSDLLDTVAVRSGMWARSFSCVSFVITAMAVLGAFIYTSESGELDLFEPVLTMSLLAGAASVVMFAGMVTGSVKITARILSSGLSGEEISGLSDSVRGVLIPAAASIIITSVTGLFFGISALSGYLTGAVITGYIMIELSNNSGQYYENTAAQSLATIIRTMIVFAAAFLPVFIKIGGFIF